MEPLAPLLVVLVLALRGAAAVLVVTTLVGGFPRVVQLGLAMGQLGRERTLLVMPRQADIKIPTDLLGLTPIKYQIGPEGDLAAAIGPVCIQLRNVIGRLGCK